MAIGKIRIGSDWQNTDRINNKIPAKSRWSPANMLKAGEVEFCAFLSFLVVSSFIETRRNAFFSRGDYRFRSGIMKDTMWRIDVNKLIDCARNGLLLQTWKLTTIFYFAESLTIAQQLDLPTERDRQLTKEEPAE